MLPVQGHLDNLRTCSREASKKGELSLAAKLLAGVKEGEEHALTSFPNANAHCRATGKENTKYSRAERVYGVDLPRGGQY